MNQDRRQQGFSLIELMVVVAITGVLAAIAIPTFTGYIYKSHTSEATMFLGQIKLRQEEFRSEFGRYLQINSAAAAGDFEFSPGDETMMVRGFTHEFPGGVNDDDWNQLGANPGGLVRFGYSMIAGLPTDAPGGPWGFPADHYFVAQATADLDGDGTACLFELTSHTNGVWYTPAKGWE